MFGAVTVPPNSVLPQGAIQMDIAIGSQIPALIGVFAPVDPCRRFAQLEVQGGTLTIAVDYQALPDGFGGISHSSDTEFQRSSHDANRCVSARVGVPHPKRGFDRIRWASFTVPRTQGDSVLTPLGHKGSSSQVRLGKGIVDCGSRGRDPWL